MKKILVGLTVFVAIIISILIQINILSVITFSGTAANIGIVITVAMGLMCDKTVGAVIGGLYGLMLDVIFGKAIGLYLLLYMLLGLCSGRVGRGFSKDNKTTLTVMVGISTILFEIISFAFGALLYGYELSAFSLVIIAIKEAIYNIIIGLILFKTLSFFAEIINKSKDSYYLL